MAQLLRELRGRGFRPGGATRKPELLKLLADDDRARLAEARAVPQGPHLAPPEPASPAPAAQPRPPTESQKSYILALADRRGIDRVGALDSFEAAAAWLDRHSEVGRRAR